jgi:hypothetical protein
MSGRRTVQREWTDAEITMAESVVDAMELSGGQIVGAGSIARAIGLPYSPGRLGASKRRVYDIMPLAVRRAAVRHPGMALVVGRDHTYRLITEETPTLWSIIDAFKILSTKSDRLSAMTGPLGPGLAPSLVRDRIELLRQACEPSGLNAVIAYLETPAAPTP